jgi:hypothetical protein
MTLQDARKHLDRLREGHPMPVALTTEALLVTGDISGVFDESLRFDRSQSTDDRTIEVESKGTESRFSYSAYLDSQQNQGIKE